MIDPGRRAARRLHPMNHATPSADTAPDPAAGPSARPDPDPTTLRPDNVDQLRRMVTGHARLAVTAGRSKTPLVAGGDGVAVIDLAGLTGLTEYEPDEYTFTAGAGTPLTELAAALAGNGQYLPFDPPLADLGATLGGTVAAGLSGAGRWRYGGLRDFILGIGFIDADGRLIRGGGRVVKNAAGFDLPKLMVGSLGRLGILTELTFKVFPSPPGHRTIRVDASDLDDALRRIARLARQPLDLWALDLEPPATLWLRVAGDEASVESHAHRVATAAGPGSRVLPAADDPGHWRDQARFGWLPDDHLLLRLALTPDRIPPLEQALAAAAKTGTTAQTGADPVPPRRYSVAGNLAWVGWPAAAPLPDLGELGGLIVRAPAGTALPPGAPRLGPRPAGADAFARRIKHALDPGARFGPLP